jgi:hypothetical protein
VEFSSETGAHKTVWEVKRVKFIAFWEFNVEDTVKCIEKLKQAMAEKERGTESLAKIIFGPYNFNGKTKGFSVYETDDPDKLMKIAIFYMPEMKWKFIPIIETSKGAELWLKMKK